MAIRVQDLMEQVPMSCNSKENNLLVYKSGKNIRYISRYKGGDAS